MPNAGAFKKGDGRARKPKGAVTKVTADLKSMILGALNMAGGADYLYRQAEASPAAFMTLVGKVLPMQVQGDKDNPIVMRVIERRIVKSKDDD